MDIRNSDVAPPQSVTAEKGDGFVVAEIPARPDKLLAGIVDALRLTIELLPGHHDVYDGAVHLPLEGRFVGGVARLRIRKAGNHTVAVDATRFAAARAAVETRVAAERAEEAVLDAVAGADVAAGDHVVVID